MVSRVQKQKVVTPEITRGGWVASGVAAERRATSDASQTIKAKRTRQNLLDAARLTFAEYGYTQATVEQIVATAGVARGSFYTYFESKLDIFRHLVALIDKTIEREVVSFERRHSGNPIDNLLISNRNYLAVVRANADLYRLVEEVAAQDSSVNEARIRSRREHISRVASSIQRWQSHGLADSTIDATTTATALVSMLSGVAQWLQIGDVTISDHDAVESLTKIWISACGLQSGAVLP